MAIGPRRIDFGENYAELDAMHLAARTAEICRATDESQRQVGVSRGSRVKQLLEKYVPNFNAEDVTTMLDRKCSVDDLMAKGYTLLVLFSAGYTIDQLLERGYEFYALKRLGATYETVARCCDRLRGRDAKAGECLVELVKTFQKIDFRDLVRDHILRDVNTLTTMGLTIEKLQPYCSNLPVRPWPAHRDPGNRGRGNALYIFSGSQY